MQAEYVYSSHPACTTCRVKRQKVGFTCVTALATTNLTPTRQFQCNGERPRCSYCSHNDLECVYSEKRKKRGPPPGYLARIADRTRLLEYFIGYLASEEERLLGPTSLDQNIHQFTALLRDDTGGKKEWTRWNKAYTQHCEELVHINLDEIDMPEASSKSGTKRTRSVSATPDAADGDTYNSRSRPQPKHVRSGSAATSTNGFGPDRSEHILPPNRQTADNKHLDSLFDSTDNGWPPDSSFALDPVPQQPGGMMSGNMNMSTGMSLFQTNFDDADEYVDVGPSTASQIHPRGKNRVTFGQVEDDGLMQDDIAEPEDRGAEDLLQQGGDGPSTAIDRQPYDLHYTSGFW